jgi:hypothetical protein
MKRRWNLGAKVIGGRWPSSKEFTPAMAAAVFVEKKRNRCRHFMWASRTTSASEPDIDPEFSKDDSSMHQAILVWVDGTVSAKSQHQDHRR